MNNQTSSFKDRWEQIQVAQKSRILAPDESDLEFSASLVLENFIEIVQEKVITGEVLKEDLEELIFHATQLKKIFAKINETKIIKEKLISDFENMKRIST